MSVAAATLGQPLKPEHMRKGTSAPLAAEILLPDGWAAERRGFPWS